MLNFFKKNIFIVPVIASVVVGTFTGVKYIVELTDTIDRNAIEIQQLQTQLTDNKEKLNDSKQNIAIKLGEVRADVAKMEASMRMGEDLYRVLADQVREHTYDLKDLSR